MYFHQFNKTGNKNVIAFYSFCFLTLIKASNCLPKKRARAIILFILHTFFTSRNISAFLLIFKGRNHISSLHTMALLQIARKSRSIFVLNFIVNFLCFNFNANNMKWYVAHLLLGCRSD